MRRAGLDVVREGWQEWEERWEEQEFWRECEVCEEWNYWYAGEAVGWDRHGRAVILEGVRTEGFEEYGMGGGEDEESYGERVFGMDEDREDDEEWDMLDDGSDGRSSTSGWEMLDGDET